MMGNKFGTWKMHQPANIEQSDWPLVVLDTVTKWGLKPANTKTFSERSLNVLWKWECSQNIFMESFLKVPWTFVWNFLSQSPGNRTFLTWLPILKIALVSQNSPSFWHKIQNLDETEHGYTWSRMLTWTYKRKKNTIITYLAWDSNHWPLDT